LDSQVKTNADNIATNAEGISTINDNIGTMGSSSSTQGNIYGGAFSSTNTVAANLEKLDKSIGNLSSTTGAGTISGDDVATKLVSLKGLISDEETARMSEDALINKKLGTLATTSKGNVSTEVFSESNSVASNLNSLDNAIGNRAGITKTLTSNANYTEEAISGKDLSTALSRVATNIGTTGDFDDTNTGTTISSSKSVNANIKTLDNALKAEAESRETADTTLTNTIGSITKTDGHLKAYNVSGSGEQSTVSSNLPARP
jgi:hypothetical protein